MKYTWLLFDIDGTLLDMEKSEKNALEKTFRQIGYKFELHYLDELRKISDQLSKDFKNGVISMEKIKTLRFELLLAAIEIHFDPQELSEKYMTNFSDCAYLINGSEEVLKSLQKKLSIALISNGFEEAQKSRIEKSRLYRYIKEIVVSEAAGAAKPNMKIFDFAFKLMNNPRKSEVLIIADSLTSDIQGGINYGIDTCWYNPKKKTNNLTITSNFEIQTLSELPATLNEDSMHT